MAAYTNGELTALYHRRVKMVYQLCLMLMKNVPDAEDCTQTVFRKVMEQEERFRDPEHEKAWLIVTARNECRDQLKKWWRTQRADASALEGIAWERPEDESIWELLLALPEGERMALYLHYYMGYSTEECAYLLRTKPATLRSRLFRGREKLRMMLEAKEDV